MIPPVKQPIKKKVIMDNHKKMLVFNFLLPSVSCKKKCYNSFPKSVKSLVK